ncbi:hypothetical protein HYPSUDRAFT_207387 [Hypholoma sublateritium FD-334 SS-4]|uniref:Uncharacterized protein n=1 Tax=Hypholoma sublateritium (strain FD-334 SS-4) TaxID=945553 RepID=A0A0D2KN69_HYPSF|nr:hypothetical protein HYPSUDRAFT_207387 [Hypholoma sublateritium FD-334 SS-4]
MLAAVTNLRTAVRRFVTTAVSRSHPKFELAAPPAFPPPASVFALTRSPQLGYAPILDAGSSRCCCTGCAGASPDRPRRDARTPNGAGPVPAPISPPCSDVAARRPSLLMAHRDAPPMPLSRSPPSPSPSARRTGLIAPPPHSHSHPLWRPRLPPPTPPSIVVVAFSDTNTDSDTATPADYARVHEPNPAPCLCGMGRAHALGHRMALGHGRTSLHLHELRCSCGRILLLIHPQEMTHVRLREHRGYPGASPRASTQYKASHPADLTPEYRRRYSLRALTPPSPSFRRFPAHHPPEFTGHESGHDLRYVWGLLCFQNLSFQSWRCFRDSTTPERRG